MSPRQSFTKLRTMNCWKIIYLETPQRNIFDKMQSKNLAIPLLFFFLYLLSVPSAVLMGQLRVPLTEHQYLPNAVKPSTTTRKSHVRPSMQINLHAFLPLVPPIEINLHILV